MDCISFFFIGLIVLIGILQSIDWIREKMLDNKISSAASKGELSEYRRLLGIRHKRVTNISQANNNSQSDLDYIEAMVVLDAAENGVFFPDGHKVFERLDKRNYYDDMETFIDDMDYFDEDFYDEDDYFDELAERTGHDN